MRIKAKIEVEKQKAIDTKVNNLSNGKIPFFFFSVIVYITLFLYFFITNIYNIYINNMHCSFFIFYFSCHF